VQALCSNPSNTKKYISKCKNKTKKQYKEILHLLQENMSETVYDFGMGIPITDLRIL
jgi:hypothetical protein